MKVGTTGICPIWSHKKFSFLDKFQSTLTQNKFTQVTRAERMAFVSRKWLCILIVGCAVFKHESKEGTLTSNKGSSTMVEVATCNEKLLKVTEKSHFLCIAFTYYKNGTKTLRDDTRQSARTPFWKRKVSSRKRRELFRLPSTFPCSYKIYKITFFFSQKVTL